MRDDPLGTALNSRPESRLRDSTGHVWEGLSCWWRHGRGYRAIHAGATAKVTRTASERPGRESQGEGLCPHGLHEVLSCGFLFVLGSSPTMVFWIKRP